MSSRNPAAAAGGTLPLWLLLLCTGLIVGMSMGRAQSMGLYLVPVTQALNIGREPFGLAMALTQLLMGIGAPVAGALIDRFTAKPVVIGCVIATMLGLYLMLEATSIPMLLASGVLMGLGVSGTGVSSLVGTVGKLAPPEKRLSAMASLGMAAGIGGFVALPVMHLLIELLGWQGSLWCLIALTGLLVPFAWPLGAKSGHANTLVREQTLKEALGEAARHPSYWLLVAGFFVCGFQVAFMMVHLPAFASDKGLASWVAPYALSAIGIANIAGTYLAGQSGKLVEKRVGLSFIYLTRSLLLLGFLLLPMTPETMIVICGLLGLVWLATIPLTSGLVATFFGTTWMSMLFGIVFLSHQIGSFLGVWLGGRLFDATRSYDAMWWMAIALGLVAALLHWPIRERPVARLAPAQ